MLVALRPAEQYQDLSDAHQASLVLQHWLEASQRPEEVQLHTADDASGSVTFWPCRQNHSRLPAHQASPASQHPRAESHRPVDSPAQQEVELSGEEQVSTGTVGVGDTLSADSAVCLFLDASASSG